MGCGCGRGNNSNRNNQQFKANLQAARRPFIPPQQQQQLTRQTQLPNQNIIPQQTVSDVDRRRIQKIRQEAIRRSLNRH